MRAPTSKELNAILEKFTDANYPQDKRDGIRKFSIEMKQAVAKSEQVMLAVATVLAKFTHNIPTEMIDIDGLALTAFCSGIVIGYQVKEAQIEKIINEV